MYHVAHVVLRGAVTPLTLNLIFLSPPSDWWDYKGALWHPAWAGFLKRSQNWYISWVKHTELLGFVTYGIPQEVKAFVTMPDYLSLIPTAQMMERENLLPQISLCHAPIHIHTHSYTVNKFKNNFKKNWIYSLTLALKVPYFLLALALNWVVLFQLGLNCKILTL